MENPYASPSPSPFSDAAAVPQPPPAGQRPRGLVGHVRVLGILMIVQGALATMMGLFVGAMAAAFPFLSSLEGQPPQPPGMVPVMVGTYITISIIALVTGILNGWAGWQITRFRQRTFGIAAISSGVLTLLTCYCGFTAIGLLIYGLIVLLDSSVKEAFELGKQGYKPEQIDALFNPWAQPGAWAPPSGPTAP